jgi:hypothetical protein
MFNSSIDCYPTAVLYCRSETDVQLALQAARNIGRQVAVRSTGHSVSGRSIADDVIVIDLSEMRDVIPLNDGIFACQGGTTWAKFDAATSRRGWAVTGGTVSSTGVGGLTLGGGIGWLLPSAGLACDSLIGACVVMADGEKRYVSDADDPEFMRCLRGLGHGLAVLTQLHFAARPLLALVAGSLTVDLNRLSDMLVDQLCRLMTNPPQSLMLSPSFIYRESRPVMSIDLAMHDPSPSDLDQVNQLARHRAVLKNTVGTRSYELLQSMLDNPARAGLRARWIPRYLNFIEPGIILQLIEIFRDAPSRENIIFLEHYHGVYGAPLRPSAFPSRDARFSLLAIANWSNAADDSANHQWLLEIDRKINRWASPREPYLNYVSRFSSRGLQDWLPTHLNVKRRVDPDGLFVNALSPNVEN